MPEYAYFCPRCGATKTLVATIRQGPPRDFCRECIGKTAMEMKRDYRADNVGFAAVPQATFVPAVGAEVSDPRQMKQHLKRMTEHSEDTLGYTPKLRARHPSELSESELPAPNPVADAYMQAKREGKDPHRTVRD